MGATMTRWEGPTFNGAKVITGSLELDGFLNIDNVPGSEKVTTGDFASATGWTLGSGWSIASGVATHTTGTAVLEQDVSAVANELYKVVFTTSAIGAGTVTVSVGGVSGTARSTNDTFTEYIKATGTGNLQFTPSNDFDGSLDDVSVKRVAITAADRVSYWTDDQTATAGKGAVFLYTEDGTGFVFGPQLSPLVNDGAPLGSDTVSWSDAFLASGAVINFDNGDVTLTHAANDLALAGGNLTINDSQTVRFGTSGAESTLGSDGTNTVFTRSSGVLRLTDGIYWLGTTARASDSTFANANMTTGWVVSQGAADNEIMAFKSSDVAHGMTSQTETDTFGTFAKPVAAAGGLTITGYSSDAQALGLSGRGVNDNTAKTTAATAYVEVYAAKKSGTTIADPGADANMLAIRTGAAGTTRFIFDQEGSGHADVEWVAYDKYNDIAMLDALNTEFDGRRDTVKAEFGAFLTEHAAELERIGIVGKDSWHIEDGRPRAMINFTKLSMLHTGALRQLGRTLEATNAKLARYEQALIGLGADLQLLGGNV